MSEVSSPSIKSISTLQSSLKKVFSFVDGWSNIPQESDTTVSRDSDHLKDPQPESKPILQSLFKDPEGDGDSDFLQRYVLYCCAFVEGKRVLHPESESLCWSFIPTTSHSGESLFQQDFHFIRRLATDCCLTRTSLMMGLHYFMSVAQTCIISTTKHNWRMILVNCFILAEKMWEDNYIHPHYMRLRFCYHCGSRIVPSASKFLELQLDLIKALEWRTNINESDYAALHGAVSNIQIDPATSQMLKSFGEARLPNRPLPSAPKMNNLSNTQ
jgi:hypothetical protein